jgi:hypothetical protein
MKRLETDKKLILVIPEGATVLRGEVAALEVDGFRLQTRG